MYTKTDNIQASIVHIAGSYDDQLSVGSKPAIGSRLTRALLHIVKAKKYKERSVGDLISNIHNYAPHAGLERDQLPMVSASHQDLLKQPIVFRHRTSTSGRRLALLCAIFYSAKRTVYRHLTVSVNS